MRNVPKKSARIAKRALFAAWANEDARCVRRAIRASQDAEKFLLPTYKRQPFVLERGKGCYVL